jgi:predicted dehydrogenase
VFAHEAKHRLRVAFLGTSGHALRNYLPSLACVPVELVALWDPDATRAQDFARTFGAPAWYTDLDRLLQDTAPDAVLIAADGWEQDEPLAASLVARCLEAGCHVWTDKPIAASVRTVRDLIARRDRVGRVAAVGAKTMFYPAFRKVQEIVSRPEFGAPTSFMCKYPLRIPPVPGLPLTDPSVRKAVTHIWHPAGAALLTMGPLEEVCHYPAPSGGGGIAVGTFRSGAVGTFHFTAGQAKTSPLERLEVVGDGTNVVVENAVHLTWYRRGAIGDYGRTPTYFTDDGQAPLTWQPEMSLGQLYNQNNFFQGYAPSLIEFVEAVLTGEPLRHGTLEDAVQILAFFEALHTGEPGQPTRIEVGLDVTSR